MSEKRITLRISGNPAEGGNVTIIAFIEKLEALKNALLHTERLISGSEKAAVKYKIIGASLKSPLTVTFEAIAVKPKNPLRKYRDLSEPTVHTFFTNLRAIRKKRIPRGGIDKPALNSYLKLGEKLGEEVFGIDIQNGKKQERITIDNEFVKNVVDLLGKEEIVFGSMSGRAEAFNVHDNSIFYIYPLAGTTRVVCKFPLTMQEEAKAALLKYVRVTGIMKYRPANTFPYEIDVTKIEELPNPEKLPTLGSLRGIISGGGKEKSEETIRRIRNAW
ncbi:MAG: hypothetical protein L0Y80_13335 [Ignavibacteriae bacterium]|nr:hypothetical protein [Ignavibacteriota bacterium]